VYRVRRGGVAVGAVGCVMRPSRCRSCRRGPGRALYGLFHPAAAGFRPLGLTCGACLHEGGPFAGLLRNLPQRLAWRRAG
jgi:hypothetical protein